MKQSSLWLKQTRHIAAVMNASSLQHLPALVAASHDAGIETLTVCTLPPDLRLAPSRDAVALIDALQATAAALTCPVMLLGRRFYLPSALLAGFVEGGPCSLKVRLAVDYASRPSLLPGAPGIASPSLLLLPRGLEPGNLLRWHFAGARQIEADWQRLEAESLAALLAPNALPPLVAAR